MIPVKGEIIHGSGNSTPAADFGAAALRQLPKVRT